MAMILQERKFVEENRSILKWEYFEDRKHRIIMSMVLEYFDQYGTTPGPDALEEEVRGLMKQAKERDDCSLVDVLDLMDHLYAKDIAQSAPHARDRVKVFAQVQTYKQTALRSLELLGRGPEEWREKYPDIISDALKVGADTDRMGHDYFGEWKERVAWRARLPHNKIPTGIAKFDKLLDGGTGPGELCILAGGTSVGKTTGLINIAAAAIEAGKKVMYYSFEQNEFKIGTKFDCRFVGKTHQELREMSATLPEKLKKKFESMMASYGRALKIAWYPSETETVATLKAHLALLKGSSLFVPDVIIIDSPDLLLAKTDNARASEHEVLGSVYNSLFNLCQEMQCTIWGASDIKAEILKATRKSDKTQPDAADLGGTYKKSKKADIVITLQQTAKERARSDYKDEHGYPIQANLTKARDSTARESYKFLAKYNKCLWTPRNAADV
jgi:hypothetical protein